MYVPTPQCTTINLTCYQPYIRNSHKTTCALDECPNRLMLRALPVTEYVKLIVFISYKGLGILRSWGLQILRHKNAQFHRLCQKSTLLSDFISRYRSTGNQSRETTHRSNSVLNIQVIRVRARGAYWKKAGLVHTYRCSAWPIRRHHILTNHLLPQVDTLPRAWSDFLKLAWACSAGHLLTLRNSRFSG